jgi:uncharacterized membrane protein YcaP (DUF421 family)
VSFYDGSTGLLRVLVIGATSYAVLIVVLRTSGKRTLAKMNAFDLVVTVALGSTLATILLSADVALAEGILAFVLLAALQAAVAWLSLRSGRIRRAVKSEPRLLVHRGELLGSALRDERVLEEEVLQALRARGVTDVSDVHAVVLETDGSFSILTSAPDAAGRSVLRNVRGASSR